MNMEQYFLRKDAKMMDAMRTRLDAEIATPDSADPKHPLWWWCDALFMAPPVYADMAAATGDNKYLTFMDHEWDVATALLYNHEKHLYFRDATFLDKHEKNGEPLFWSRGNGWVMGALVKVLETMPANDPKRAQFVQQLRDMAAVVAALQGPDGLWRSGLLDADSYPLPEISGSAFFTYAMAYGINQHILDRRQYLPVVERAWQGMLRHIYADGRLGAIQPIDGQPGKFKPSASYVYGVGGFLLAGSEVDRLAHHRK
jgi:unsaturated rhamnogalacturonyl hydrolase